MISGIIKVLASVISLGLNLALADNTCLELDYSGYHKNPIQLLFIIIIVIVIVIVVVIVVVVIVIIIIIIFIKTQTLHTIELKITRTPQIPMSSLLNSQEQRKWVSWTSYTFSVKITMFLHTWVQAHHQRSSILYSCHGSWVVHCPLVGWFCPRLPPG